MRLCSPIFLLALTLPMAAHSVDLGKYGETYEIIERDIRDVLQEQLMETDFGSINDGVKEKAENIGEHLPQFNLPPIRKTTSKLVAIEYVLDRDLYSARKNTNGEIETFILHRKGTVVRPFEHIKPKTNMLFVSGRSEAQIQFALEASKLRPNDLFIVLTSGNVQTLSKKYNMHFYYANADLINKFDITHTPSMVGIAKTPNDHMVAVTAYALPVEPEIINQTWNGM